MDAKRGNATDSDTRHIKKEGNELKFTGILRVDLNKPKPPGSARSQSLGPVEFQKVDRLGEDLNEGISPSSPVPSVDRLSVTWADNEDQPISPTLSKMEVRFPPDEAGDNSEDEDYSASVSAIMLRRASTMKRRGSRARRSSSPFSFVDPLNLDNRRRSSCLTTSSAEVDVSMEDSAACVVTQEQIFQNIHLHKEVLRSAKQQPLEMKRKLRLVAQAKLYIKKHEGVLQERLAHSKCSRDIFARFNILLMTKLQNLKREAANWSKWLVPWELRIKEIESHFGSVVASYFTFLRWLFWVNMVITTVLIVFVVVPEILMTDMTDDRKHVLPEDRNKSLNLLTLWEFDGILRFSPIFYGYYTNKDAGERGGYRLPLAYFMTGLAVYIYSFVATLRKMAKNSRMSKLSEKEDECIFSWKIFTGWDYMIGNSETAHNRTASIILGFKEALLEEAEKKKDVRNWKIIFQRIAINICILFLFGVSAFAVVQVVRRSNEAEAESSWWRQNEITIVMSLISYIFPNFFELLGLFENYHPRRQLRIQLARIMVLNLLNLYSLIITLFSKITDMTEEFDQLNSKLEITKNTTTISTVPLANCCNTSPTLLKVTLTTLILTSASKSTYTPSTSPAYTEEFTPTTYYNIYEDTNMTTTPFGLIAENVTAFNQTIYDYEDDDDVDDDFYENVTNDDSYSENSMSYYYTDKQEIGDNNNKSFTNSMSTPEQNSTFLYNGTVDDIQSSTVSIDFNDKIVFNQMRSEHVVSDEKDNFSEMLPTAWAVVQRDDPYKKVPLANRSLEIRRKMSKLCWETIFGQELVKLTIMDLCMSVLATLFMDFIRAVFIRYMNSCWCWDLEKKFPQYGDFKIAENILHLVNNQGMVWMGMFFSPGLVAINLVKLVILMYLRSWAVMTCNVPHEIVFRASRSNNFYLALLLTMLFLCVLPVSYAIVWVRPSRNCGPFSNYERIYYLFTESLMKVLPETFHKALDYISSPGIVIPLLVLLILIIYYLLSLTGALREANNDLKIQLRRERTEERRKMFQLADRRRRGDSNDSETTPFSKWKKIMPMLPTTKPNAEKKQNDIKPLDNDKKDFLARVIKLSLRKPSGASIEENGLAAPPAADEETDTEFHESLPEDVLTGKDIKFDIKSRIFKNRTKSEPVKTLQNEQKVTKVQSEDGVANLIIENEIGDAGKRDKTKIKSSKIRGIIKESKDDKNVDQRRREDSVTSIIPVITISKTENDENDAKNYQCEGIEKDASNSKILTRQTSVESTQNTEENRY